MARTNKEVAILAGRIGLGLMLIYTGYGATVMILSAIKSMSFNLGSVLIIVEAMGAILGVLLLIGFKLRTVAAIALVFAIYKSSLLFSLIATGLILTAKSEDEG